MGIETAVLPTAVLSNHTAFSRYTIHDLTDEFQRIADCWAAQEITFDGVYSGYLASAEQIRLVGQFMETQAGALGFVDPAMADHGRLYVGFDDAFVERMGALCGSADVIVPNLTEACLMTGTPYRDDPDPAFYRELCKRLAGQGTLRVVITGYTESENSIGAIAYDRERDAFVSYVNERLETPYHGTGDIFASVTFGALMRGMALEEALTTAVNYVLACMKYTAADPEHRVYGVNFEQALPDLIRELQ